MTATAERILGVYGGALPESPFWRRVRLFSVSHLEMVRASVHPLQVVSALIPQGAKLCAKWLDPLSQSTMLLYQHESFPAYEVGEELPVKGRLHWLPDEEKWGVIGETRRNPRALFRS